MDTNNQQTSIPPQEVSNAPEPYQTQNQPVPGKGISVAGFILALLGLITFGFTSLIGLILSIIGRVQTKRAGQPSGLALGGIIISIITMIIGAIVAVAAFAWLFSQGAKLNRECSQRGPGTHYVQWLGQNAELTCSSDSEYVDIKTSS